MCPTPEPEERPSEEEKNLLTKAVQKQYGYWTKDTVGKLVCRIWGDPEDSGHGRREIVE